jgi:hypothetical protein
MSVPAGAICFFIWVAIKLFARTNTSGYQPPLYLPQTAQQRARDPAAEINRLATPENIRQSTAAIREYKRRKQLPPGSPRPTEPLPQPIIGESMLRLLGVKPEDLEPSAEASSSRASFPDYSQQSSGFGRSTTFYQPPRTEVAPPQPARSSTAPTYGRSSSRPSLETSPSGSALRQHESFRHESEKQFEELNRRMEADRKEWQQRNGAPRE